MQRQDLQVRKTPETIREPVATLVEQQVAIEMQGVNLPGGSSLMSESPLSKATRLQTLECLLFLLCLYMFAATNLSLVSGKV